MTIPVEQVWLVRFWRAFLAWRFRLFLRNRHRLFAYQRPETTGF